MRIRRGDILWVEFRGGNGHIQSGRRPCIVVSTDYANGGAHTFNVIPGTTSKNKKRFIYHLHVEGKDISGYLEKDTTFLTEQITTVDRNQILMKAGHVSEAAVQRMNKLIIRQLGIKIGDGENE